MKIKCTTMEFARLVRWCEGSRYYDDCRDCPVLCFANNACDGIEEYCEVSTESESEEDKRT